MYNPAAEIEACQTDVLLRINGTLHICSFHWNSGEQPGDMEDSNSPLPYLYYIYMTL